MTEKDLHNEYRESDYKTFIDFLINKIADIKANCDLAIEGRDIKIRELEEENNKLIDVINNQDVKITDLEKKNAELKSELTKKADTNHLLVEQMADLESENAELKRDKEDLIFVRNQKADHINELKDLLTSATKFLNEFMRISKASDEDFEHDYSELIGVTEQFLEKVK